MTITRWTPPVAPTRQEQFLLKRLGRVRKLLGFLRLHRHELFDDAFQTELASMYRTTGAGKDARPPAMMALAMLVQGYLGMSDAVVVFATADLEAGEDRYTRPNIGDEIGRARSQPHLRNRICVLKEHGVTLPSNINPAYESLDLAHPEEGFRRALAQLREWGLHVDPLAASHPAASG